MTDIVPLTRFFTRVRQASQNGAKDIRLTTSEATELAATIGQILTERSVTPAPTNTGSIVMDGGSMKAQPVPALWCRLQGG